MSSPGTVLLVAAEWRLRAMLRAQLLEDGVDVEALDSAEEAELILRARPHKPALLVFDVADEPNPPATLASLAQLIPPHRALILTAASIMPADAIQALGFPQVVSRPFTVGEVASRVERLLADAGRRLR